MRALFHGGYSSRGLQLCLTGLAGASQRAYRRSVRTQHSFCRICANTCGVVLEIDEEERIVSIKGDRDHVVTEGYACSKGREAGEMHRREDRILRPLKRRPDGSFAPIPLEDALDEIAARLRDLVDRHGPHAIAGFLGTTGYFNVASSLMFVSWLQALGSRSFFSSFTIDCSNKAVTAGRLGVWGAGKQLWADADVWMLVGTNPFVSLSSQGGIPFGNPAKEMKRALARGVDLIVVDTRRSETARHAKVFLQPRPGEDPAVVAGIVRLILTEGLADDEFCQRYASGLAELRGAVEPFTPDYVERRAGVDAGLLREAALVFGGAGKRGCAGGGTGIGMSPDSNLTDHLIETLNVVCGRFRRAGETVANGGGALFPRVPRHAEVLPPARPWERGYRSRVRGFGKLPSIAPGGEVPTGILADEILEPGEGQIRSLFVEGGNPALAIPDQVKVFDALSSLELLVTVDPFMSATARLSHYVLPPRMMYERADVPMLFGSDWRVQRPFTQYTEAIVEPPAGSEVIDDWQLYWGLAERLGLELSFCGETLDPARTPTNDELIALAVRNGQVPFEEIVKHPHGSEYELPPLVVEPARPQAEARFEVMPDDVAAELAGFHALGEDGEFTHRLAVRRMRQYMNSLDPAVPEDARSGRFNPAYLHPDDIGELGLSAGEEAEIVSDHARVRCLVEPDDRLLRGVVSISHCFGGLPGEDKGPEDGTCTNLLVDTSRHFQAINAMPTMSGLPVKVARVRAGGRAEPASSPGSGRSPGSAR